MCDCSQAKKDMHSVEYPTYWIQIVVCGNCGRKISENRVEKPKPNAQPTINRKRGW